MKYVNIVTIIITAIHLAAAWLFIYSLGHFWVFVSCFIYFAWVVFTGLVMEIAENKDPDYDRWS